VHCDVSSDAQVGELAARARATFGHVDILMNNAGVMLRGRPEEMPIDEWEWIFGINFFGVVRGIRAFVPQMIARGSGHVINTASIGGLHGGRWHSAGYSSSKFAVVGLSETLFMYLKPQSIGVSVLCPGGVRTNLLEGIRFSTTVDDPEKFGGSEEFGPQAVEPEDVAPLVLDAIETKRFLILTDPRYQTTLQRKAADVDAYLNMRAGSGAGL
jgi:NAD(P)-dependent dehydrogenase (short-subunit alcohol dehydrogenase family)